MSATPHDDTTTPDADAAQPQIELTDTQSTVHTRLLAFTEEVTAAEITVAAGLGRSTTSKALVALESKGLAIRIHGGHDGPRRVPDLWRAVPKKAPSRSNTAHIEDPDGIRPCDATKMSEKPSSGSNEAATPQTPDAEQHTTTSGAHEQTSSTVKRLAPGGLRQMVVEHLKAYPENAFTATGISRAISKSSGAIANALVTLTKQGIAQQVDERPRTYRLKRSESSS